MSPPPATISRAKVLWYTPIDRRHRFTGNCKQFVAGELLGEAYGLAICLYPGDSNFYLFGCDANWKAVTDTCHGTVEEAKHQAEFEYVGSEATWVQMI